MRWYIPGRDGSRPAHLPPLHKTGCISVATGPDGGEGRIYNGTYNPGETGWVQVPGQPWWINPTGSHPHLLLRMDARDGTEIEGVDDHRWLIPHLLRPLAGSLVWAGESRLGPDGWSVPAPPEPWCSIGSTVRDILVRAVVDKGVWEEIGQAGVEATALRIICSNYNLHPDELRISGWVRQGMIADAFHSLIAGA